MVPRLDCALSRTIRFPTFTVVVEAKTGSEEHPPPSGELQTLAYPEAVRYRLNLHPDHQLYIVFLTPERRPAANPKAILTTYYEFATRSSLSAQEKLGALLSISPARRILPNDMALVLIDPS